MTAPSHVTTQFEAFLYQAKFTDDSEREELTDALADPTVGIVSVAMGKMS